MPTLNQHGRLASPYYTQPPPAEIPAWKPFRGKLGLWHLRMPDGTSRGPFCSRKLARKSITFYRREWQAKIAAAELAKATPAPKRRKEVAAC